MADKTVWTQNIGWAGGDGMPFGFSAEVAENGTVTIAARADTITDQDEIVTKGVELALSASQLKALADLALAARLVGVERAGIWRTEHGG